MYKIITLLFTIIILTACGAPQSPSALECENGGGAWETFSNTCVDSCTTVDPSERVCGAAQSSGCDCGPDKCWNGTTCEKEGRKSALKMKEVTCEDSGGTFVDENCECPDETYGDDLPLYTYEEETGYCMDAFGIPGGALGEQAKEDHPLSE